MLVDMVAAELEGRANTRRSLEEDPGAARMLARERALLLGEPSELAWLAWW